MHSLAALCGWGNCSYRVKPDGHDPTEVLLRKRQEKYYVPLVKWYEEVRADLLWFVCGGCILTRFSSRSCPHRRTPAR